MDFPGDSRAGARDAWRVVAAIIIVGLTSAGVINLYVSSIFLVPVTTGLGISRGTYSAGILFCQTFSAFSCLITGMLIDRVGPRRVMLVGIPCYASAIALLSQMTPSLYVIMPLFIVAGLVSPSHSPLTYGAVMTRWFSRRLGFALGLALVGGGLGTTLLPLILSALLDLYGWRFTYLALGAIIVLVSWLPAYLFVHVPPRQPRLEQQRPRHGAYLRSRHFWWLACAFLIGIPPVGGAFAHVPALFADRGIDATATAWAMSAGGICLIIGRVVSGWLLDRCFAPYITATIFALPIGGLLLLLSGWGGATPFVAVILLALCLGAEVDLMGYLISRYFALEIYGRVYGVMMVIFSVAAGFGPWLAGYWYDHAKSYDGIFLIFLVALTASVALLATLGNYVYAPAPGHDETAG